MRLVRRTFLAVATALVACVAAAQTGMVPLVDLGDGDYLGFPGGLYPGGANVPPPAHREAALLRAAQVVPRNALGQPAAGGWIAMLAIGMSNTTHEFAVFERDQDANPARNARLVLIDSALGGQSAGLIANPDAPYWSVVDQRVAAMGLTAAQVQVVWLKEAQAQPPANFPIHAQDLQADLVSIVQTLRARFPNLALCYLSSRTYGGYATGSLNPEPQAYESGFSVKWLIEDQIEGDPALSYGQLPGPAQAPLLLWGPYLWADGPLARSDGLVWLPSDFEAEGTHPSPAGEQKVADLLSAFFETDITARAWWPRQDDAVLVALDAGDDTYVDGALPAANFGAAPQLLARGGSPPALIYLAFDTGPRGSISALAKLGARVVDGGGGAVRAVADTSWDESSLTFENRPAPGPPLVQMPFSSRDGTIGAAVTGSVHTDDDGVVSFALTAPGAAEMRYHSEEGGQPPRLVLSVPCELSPDSDGDGVGDVCDCAPGDPLLSRVPREIAGLGWTSATTLVWDSDAAHSGTATRYDVMSGGLQDVASYETGPEDVCLGDDLPGLSALDTSPAVVPGEGRFFLVRGDNACGAGRWQTATDGRDRATAVCP